ncbi:hypothetical protein [Aliamphritea spongicola]|nr:hypothetical protein [Aliamphritea spongicola]
MTDTPWSNRQQQMVQEYLDALLTDPETAVDQSEAVEEVDAVQPVAAEAEQSVDVMAAESAMPDTLNETEELPSETAEIAVLADDNVSEEFDAEPVLATELAGAEPESEEPLELADIQTEEHLTEVEQAAPAESMSEIPPDSEEALDAALCH